MTAVDRAKYFRQFLIAACIALLAFCFTYLLMSKQRYTGAFQYVCRQVYLKHYLGPAALKGWYEKCLADRERVTPSMSAEKVADIFRQRFALLETSHLEIFSPQDDKLAWSGHAEGDNGIRTRGINGRIIVSRVIEKSSAEEVGIRAGDIIISVYGEKAYGSYPYNEVSGDIVVQRDGKEIPFKVRAGELQVDFTPQLKRLADDVGLLTISSFRKEYFGSEAWSALTDSIQDYPSLIIDLRGNLGGDFNAVIKTLSFFMCGKDDFGSLVRPAAVGEPTMVFKENSNEDEFYEQLTHSGRLKLERFKGSCFDGALTVLIDGDTSSVSEIFASILKERRQTRVWGERSRGDMLLGVWYPLSALAPGYTLSIPEALYVGPEGKVIEGKGVTPQRTLFYQYDDAIHGRDSWVKTAMSAY